MTGIYGIYNVLLTGLIEMLTIWRDIEVGRSVVVELTRIWLRWYIVVMFASNIRGAGHTAAHNTRSSWHSFVHFDTQCWMICRTQSRSIGRSSLQFHTLPMSFNSRQRHYHQPCNYRQKVYWRHCFVFVLTTSAHWLLAAVFSTKCFAAAISMQNESTQSLVFGSWRLHVRCVCSNGRQQCEVPGDRAACMLVWLLGSYRNRTES